MTVLRGRLKSAPVLIISAHCVDSWGVLQVL
eukprot:COSAG01_NODE_94_length_26962_cov_9.110933_22_plen_31_part_00